MLPLPSRHELLQRLPRLIVGLVLYGIGISLQVVAGLGLAPWDVLHQGISRRTGIPLGTVGIIIGFIVLVLWFPLRQRFGVGTIANALLIGTTLDICLWLLPETVEGLAMQSLLLASGIVIVAIGSGLYIGVGLGPGPRDGLMTGLASRGMNIAAARAIVEISVLVIGWLLGGTVGIGTALFAFGIGPLIAIFLPRFTLAPLGRRVPDPHLGTMQ